MRNPCQGIQVRGKRVSASSRSLGERQASVCPSCRTRPCMVRGARPATLEANERRSQRQVGRQVSEKSLRRLLDPPPPYCSSAGARRRSCPWERYGLVALKVCACLSHLWNFFLGLFASAVLSRMSMMLPILGRGLYLAIAESVYSMIGTSSQTVQAVKAWRATFDRRRRSSCPHFM
ncbi:hypothetical protein B0T26DRAFT_686333, partial [Lasiosphaeria miniovina]